MYAMETNDRPKHCRECGAVISYSFSNADELEFFGLCFNCDFWLGHAFREDQDDPAKTADCRQVVAEMPDGAKHHYAICQEPSASTPKNWLGFGGSEFIVEFFSGETVTTHNLWSQGVIPVHLRDRFETNAFICRGLVNGGAPKEVLAERGSQ